MENDNKLFSHTLKTTGKTYFFDVSEAKNGSKYLRVTESRKSGEEYIRKDITLFPGAVDDFVAALQESVKALQVAE